MDHFPLEGEPLLLPPPRVPDPRDILGASSIVFRDHYLVVGSVVVLKTTSHFVAIFHSIFCPTCVKFFGYWLNFDAKMLSYLKWIFSSILLSNFDPLDSEIYCFS